MREIIPEKSPGYTSVDDMASNGDILYVNNNWCY